jgi:hypothetical protein
MDNGSTETRKHGRLEKDAKLHQITLYSLKRCLAEVKSSLLDM